VLGEQLRDEVGADKIKRRKKRKRLMIMKMKV
jgi:hypothetical protein